MADTRPELIVNPLGDERFRKLAQRLLDAAGPCSAEELQSALRGHYPRAVARRRSLWGERLEVWYVYREGYWINSRGPEGTTTGGQADGDDRG